MKRLLLDLNVFLDVILDRPPDADVAAALWAAIERGHGHGMVPAHGVTTIFYLLEKARGAAFARDGVERLIRVFGVAPVNDDVVRRALAIRVVRLRRRGVCGGRVTPLDRAVQDRTDSTRVLRGSITRLSGELPTTIWGEPRATIDVDVTVSVDEGRMPETITTLARALPACR